MSKYTPGEWRFNEASGVEESYVSSIHGGFTHVIANDVHNEDDARLISAAPNILEALEQVVSDLFYQISSHHDERTARDYPSLIIARAAIAKAKGVQP